MRVITAALSLLCAPFHSVGADRSSLTAWTTPLRCARSTSSPAETTRCSATTTTSTTTTSPAWTAASRATVVGASTGVFSKNRRCGSLSRRAPALSSTGPAAASAAAPNAPQQQQSLFIFGVGYVATAIALTYLRKGWAVHGTCTDPRKVKTLGEQGIKAYIFDDWSGPMMQPEPLEALASATCVLSTVPPALQTGTDPVLVAHSAELQWAHSNGSLRWVGYLSSTGVYGDRGGGWVTEEDEPWPAAPRTKARLKAERSWLRLHQRDGIPAHVFRLAGIYGPGRSALDAVSRHKGDIRLAGSDDGTMVSRVHVSDIVGVLEASMELPEPGMVVNVADDLPATRYETLAYGCKLLGFPRQDPDPGEKYVNRRGGGNKRVDNGKMRALLAASGRALVFPDYRSGLKALQEGDGRPFTEEAAALATATGTASLAGGQAKAPPTQTAGATTVGGPGGEGGTSVASELRALRAQVSRLEDSLGRVLASLGQEGTASTMGDDDAGESSPGEFVGRPKRIETSPEEEGDALPDGVKHLAVGKDSSP